MTPLPPRPARPRLFYGWIVVAIAFVTMGVAVSARTGYSLLLPEIVAEFGWDSSLASGAFSVGFVMSTAFLPVVGFLMGRFGPRATIPVGAIMVAAGYLYARHITSPIELYAAFGLLAINGSMAMSYISHSMFLPYWFVRNRGLALGLAFGGVGALGAVLLPAMQWLIETEGWRTACLAVAITVAVVIIPLNILFQRPRPEAMGLMPDGDVAPEPGQAGVSRPDPVVDRAWVETDWTLARAVRTARFWWLGAAYFGALFVWYAIQIHQTRHLLQAGFDGATAAFALGMVAFFGIAGQIGIGALSDRVGREIGWTIATAGFAVATVLLIWLDGNPSPVLLWAMVVAQGLIGNGTAAIFGAIPAELFSGRRYPAIFSSVSLIANFGAGAGVWMMGAVHDSTGNYQAGLWVCLAVSIASGICVWLAGPRKVRLVAGVAARRAREATQAAQ